MKTSVMLMAGILTVALAGSAQAASTMFAVQDTTGTVDKMVVQDNGYIGIGTPTPSAPIHVITSGNSVISAGFNYTFTNTGTLSALKAPNFSFYRANDAAATGTKNPNDATLPRANDDLGSLTFGALVSGSGVNMAKIVVKSEGTPTLTSLPGYIMFYTAHDNAGASALSEKFRVSALGNVIVPAVTTNTGGGNLMIGEPITTIPISKLHVNGLTYYASNAAAVTGLGIGGFYRCGGTSDATADVVCVAH